MKSVKFKITLFALLTTFPIQAIHAQPNKKDPYCVIVFKKMNKELSQGYVKTETQQRIANYFFDETLSPKERARMTFLAVLSDRMSLLKKNEAAEVEKFLKEKVFISYNDLEFFYGGFISNPTVEKHIMMSVPEALNNTIFEYAVLVHELEHYIQELVATRPIFGSFKHILNRTQHYVGVTYESEIGAMMSEFEFMNSIPREKRLDALEYIKKNRHLFNRDTLHLLVSILALHNHTPTDYVETQHRGGRYDIEMVEKKASEYGMQEYGPLDQGFDRLLTTLVVLPTVITIGVLATPAAISGLKNFCTKSLNQDKSNLNDSLLEICKKMQ